MFIGTSCIMFQLHYCKINSEEEQLLLACKQNAIKINKFLTLADPWLVLYSVQERLNRIS